MPRTHSILSLRILRFLEGKDPQTLPDIYSAYGHGKRDKKKLYDTLFRLDQQDLVALTQQGYILTVAGDQFINQALPEKDGTWKIIIFDIPEKKRKVRNFLRHKLKTLGFKKWQASTWISPYRLEPELEKELKQLATHYFIRLIKTNDINVTKDLYKLFPDNN